MKKLENCEWAPRWVSHLGCIQGCCHYLGIELSDAWLYGGTGHAFVLNMHEEVCPSGPTAWMTGKLFELAQNLPYRVEGVFGSKDQENFAELQRQAWDHARRAIDAGHPCYGWELAIPEYYVVNGYTDDGYLYSGPDATGAPQPWQALGNTDIGMLELYSVQPGDPSADATTVKQALSFALEFAGNPETMVLPHYRAGLAGYDTWIGALETGRASDMGTRYNTGVWLECRRNAAAFLEEAQARLPGRAAAAFDEAIAAYQAVAEHLAAVAELYPWEDHASDEDVLPVDDRSRAAVTALQAARAAEATGLQALEQIVAAL